MTLQNLHTTEPGTTIRLTTNTAYNSQLLADNEIDNKQCESTQQIFNFFHKPAVG